MIPPAPPPPAEIRFIAGATNIKHDEHVADRLDDIKHMAQMLGQGSWVVGGCEIDNRPSRIFWHGALRGLHIGGETEAPVALSHSWDLIGHRVFIRTSGEAGIDPPRPTVLAKARDITTGIKVAEVNTHMDHLWWTTPERRARWNAHHRADQRLIRRLRLLGYTVIATEDTNHGTPVFWGKGQIIAANAGLMQITVLPPIGLLGLGVKVSVGDVDEETGHTDHPLLAVPVTIRRG